MTLQPTRLVRDTQGNAWSDLYGDVYASRDGALGQARHVFLNGNRLPARWRGHRQFVILETGFGVGVNFLATWRAWRDDPERPSRLQYVSVELHPLAAEDLVAGAPAELRPLAQSLARAWSLATPGLHRIELESGHIVLTLAFGDARELLPRLDVGADAFYLDGFAPARNPQMWEPALLKAVGRCARAGATLATYTTARSVRDALAAAGFDLQMPAGYGHKRRMLVGEFAPRWRIRRHEPPTAYRAQRNVIVVGAGIAGCACADAFARRGWSVRVVDRHAGPAQDASALPWGLVHPQFALDDAPLARLTRAGVEAALSALAVVAPDGQFEGASIARSSGVFQLADSDEGADRWREAIQQQGLPREWIEWMSETAAAERIGLRPRGPGLWWTCGAIVSPSRWSRAWLARHAITVRAASVGRIESTGVGWRLLSPSRGEIDSAPIVVVATALESPSLLGCTHAPVRAVPGRLTMLQPDAWTRLRAPVTGDGTLLRDPEGGVAIGATYDTNDADDDANADERAARSNLARVSRLIAAPPPARAIGAFAGVRCVAHDRLPMAGPVQDDVEIRIAADALRGAHLADLPRRAGLYACFALGSRGLTLAPLLGELIAAQIEGEPLPIERDLAGAVDPARFALRAVRRGQRVSVPCWP